MNLLLIESDPVLRTGYAYCLESKGWRVIQSSRLSSNEYLSAPVGATIVDAGILTDQKKQLWFELARVSSRPVIVLVLTQADEAQLRRCRLPHVTFLVKPFSLRRLTQIIDQMAVLREVA